MAGSISGGENMGRCKQCGKPLDITNRIKGPTGAFCSEPCRVQHEAFVGRVGEMEAAEGKGGGGFLLFALRLRSLLSSCVVLLVLLLLAGFAGTVFEYEIPVISTLYFRILGLVGL
jgi:hypothetical protein